MRRGQASIEYMLIIALTIAVLVPGVYFFFTYSQHSTASVAAAQYARLGNELLAASLKTVAQGEGSSLMLDASIPEGVIDIFVASNGSELVIRYMTPSGPTDAVFFTDVPLIAPGGDGSLFASAPHDGRISILLTAGADGKVSIAEQAEGVSRS